MMRAALAALACVAWQQAAGQVPVTAELRPFLDGKGRLLARLDADVTGDGVPDVVIVHAPPDSFDASITVLMRKDGLAGIDAMPFELTPYGPPKLAVRNGVLLVQALAGGSSVRTESTHRFRFDGEEGRMRLIGLDAERTSPTAAVRLSWNLLSGARTVRRGTGTQGNFSWGPEQRSSRPSHKVWMDTSPTADEALDQAAEAKPRR